MTDSQQEAAPPGSLYVVATPIGNLGDLAPRAVEVLRSVERIAAEDTRHSRKLLQHFAIQTPLVAVHEHNEREIAPRLVEQLRAGGSLALISDAGTPLISDPGFNLVRNIPVMGHAGEGYFSHAEILYQNCRVPRKNLLGPEGHGFVIAQERLGPGRIHHCMRWIGICNRAFDLMCARARDR